MLQENACDAKKLNIIEETLLNHIADLTSFFVFPTQTACDLWLDRIITISNTKAVAMERFITWDTFKSSSIKSRQKGKVSIPTAMRSIFVSNLIHQNAQNPFFKNLIVPEYAKSASGFVSWLTNLLPSLFTWKKQFENSNAQPDDEDFDLLELFNRYSAFLNENNFFDPAWENPPFMPDGNHYFVFFPEILSDYCEYEPILLNSPESITSVFVPEELLKQKPATCHFMENARQELRAVSLYIRNLYENQNIDWNEIAVSVPDIENYAPYIERDFSLYGIPYCTKNATPLNSTKPGNLFSQILECSHENFSFESLKTLLLNDSLPWKKEIPVFNLIDFGKENNCVCSFEYKNEKIDVWNKSFSKPIKNPDEQANLFYSNLKKDVLIMVNSTNFEALRKNYFIFREHFFNMDECSAETDNILSRCISELGELIKLEKAYKFTLPSPFSFFATYIGSIKYLAQTLKSGVQILPYKLSCCAPFKAQIVLDSSQNGLSIIYKQLSFLRDDKRKKLMNGKDDPNVSERFVKLYEMSSIDVPAFFTCSSKTFTGYAQTSSYLSELGLKNDEEIKSLLKNDYYSDEKQFFLNSSNESPKKIFEVQKNGLSNWIKSQKTTETDELKSIQIEKNKILSGKFFNEKNQIRISSTMLNRFFDCPRMWAIEECTSLSEQHNEAEIADHRTLGNLYHKIFELFCETLKTQNLQLIVTDGNLPENYLKILFENIDTALEIEKNSYLTKELLKTTKSSIVKTAVNAVTTFSSIFNGCTVYNTEGNYQYEDTEQNCILNGRIDCLLLDPSSTELFLIDFKSFDSAIPDNIFYDKEKNILPDFQMPMYLELLEKQEKSLQVENCCFFNVTKAEIKLVFGQELSDRVSQGSNKNKKIVPTANDFLETREIFNKSVSTCIERIKNADFSVSHNEQTFSVCNRCRYKALCRRTFTVSQGE